MSNPAFRFDHVHIIARDPHASARWYVEKLGATIAADTLVRGAPQIFVALGGITILIRGKRPGRRRSIHGRSSPSPTFRAMTSGVPTTLASCTRVILRPSVKKLRAKGVALPVPLKKGVNGALLCYIAAPDNVSIELMQE